MNASAHTPITVSHTRGRRTRHHKAVPLIAIAATVLGLAGCSATTPEPTLTESSGVVKLVVHDSFPNEEFEAAASAATGYDVQVISAGDGGELTNKLVLTQGAPIADAFFGIDNVFASRVIDAGVVAGYESPNLPENALQMFADTEGVLSPVTRGATCINIDPAWFAAEGMPEPQSYEDLTQPEYASRTVLLDPSSSSTGASFLIGTVAKFGADNFTEYWAALQSGGARIEQSWSDAYNGQFTQGGGDGTYPIVLSYSSSPAWTVSEDGTSTSTTALLDTCSSQIEYAGVLEGAADPIGAQAVVDYLLSPEFQGTIAESMYVYPIDDTVELPADWASFAALPDAPHDLTPTEIGAGRDEWLRTWSDVTGW